MENFELSCAVNLIIFSGKKTLHNLIKGGFKSEGRGGFSQLPKMSAEKTILGFKKLNSDFFCIYRLNRLIDNASRSYL